MLHLFVIWNNRKFKEIFWKGNKIVLSQIKNQPNHERRLKLSQKNKRGGLHTTTLESEVLKNTCARERFLGNSKFLIASSMPKN